jgi:hypothetical protein
VSRGRVEVTHDAVEYKEEVEHQKRLHHLSIPREAFWEQRRDSGSTLIELSNSYLTRQVSCHGVAVKIHWCFCGVGFRSPVFCECFDG